MSGAAIFLTASVWFGDAVLPVVVRRAFPTAEQCFHAGERVELSSEMMGAKAIMWRCVARPVRYHSHEIKEAAHADSGEASPL